MKNRDGKCGNVTVAVSSSWDMAEGTVRIRDDYVYWE